ncbi:winged helix DNA-binding protein [Sphingosinithalassobacter sp. CS137]|uniref:winged helix DNA-binding protein n=1 Tax=Sphingosinithalassobacter sp. CS137 TaxID=2762748 RepID=UPI0021D3EB80|nr:winged helix DNA-binding protein [Sphingosinithalassobacter sp. CS137]
MEQKMNSGASMSASFSAAGDGYSMAPDALLIADSTPAAEAAAEALALSGMRLRRRIGFAEAEARLAEQVGFDVIAIEGSGVDAALFDGALAAAARSAQAQSAAVVVAIAPDQIDIAAARLLGSGAQLLCDPGTAERVAALLATGHRPSAQLHDASRDGEAARLRRLNEEVARIADTLARLTRGEDADRRGGGLREPGSDYRGPENAGETAGASAQEIRAVIRTRRMRGQFFADELFADPAWDMLLDLFAAELEDRRVSVSSLCIAAAVPPTTALRWIGTMHEAGLFQRNADPNDRRRAYIALSEKGLQAMRAYSAAVKRQGLSLV